MVLSACADLTTKSTSLLQPGDYRMVFDIDTLKIPAQLRVNEKGEWSIINWTEHIRLDSIRWMGNVFFVKMPYYNSTLDGNVVNDTTVEGIWTDRTRPELYEIHFTATRQQIPEVPLNGMKKKIYSVEYAPGVPEHFDEAIGLFYQKDTLLYGTFITKSGDHRFLQGFNDGKTFTLSCFDGAHLFYYKAGITNDSLSGMFYSGKHYSRNWVGYPNPQAHLMHPDSVVWLKDSNKEFSFKVRAQNGDSVLFNREKFLNKVTVVQVMGSWCANCTDESRFFKTLYDKYHSEGMEIVPIAFERSDVFEINRDNVNKQFVELGLKYTPYFGTKIGPGAASQVLTNLTRITAYPTSVFIDKKGNVRKIHTGFYGPGTGDYYRIYTTELESFVQQLLHE